MPEVFSDIQYYHHINYHDNYNLPYHHYDMPFSHIDIIIATCAHVQDVVFLGSRSS